MEPTPAAKHKLPILLMLIGILILVVAVSVVGVWLSQKKYDTVTDRKASSDTSEAAYQDESDVSGDVSDDSDIVAHSIAVTGDVSDDFDATLYTKRLYELKMQFAVSGFQSVSDLTPSVVVQYAFCHLYYDSLVDMPQEKDMLLREVLPDSISSEVKELFGDNQVDITKSDLYESDQKLFEMWQPKLRAAVYADTVCAKLSDTSYQLTSTFYKTKDKTEILSTVTGIFIKQNDHYILSGMQTKS